MSRNTGMNIERRMTALIAFMAAAPAAGPRRSSALMMKAEKAKYRPASNPQPSAQNHNSAVVMGPQTTRRA